MSVTPAAATETAPELDTVAGHDSANASHAQAQPPPQQAPAASYQPSTLASPAAERVRSGSSLSAVQVAHPSHHEHEHDHTGDLH